MGGPYDVHVPRETPRSVATSSRKPVPLVPVSAEDFARANRRVVLRWLVAALLIILSGFWMYQKVRSSLDARKALRDGERMLKAGRYTESIQALDRALSARSGLVDAYLLRARANSALYETDAALRDYTTVIQLQPRNAGAFVERAAIRLRSSDYQGVVADCGEAIRLDPKFAYAYTLRGIAFRARGNLPESLQDFDRTVELAPQMDSYFQRATTYQLMGQHSKALADLDQVISLNPTNPMGYLARAKSREAIGDAAGARGDRENGDRLEGRGRER